MFYEEYEKAYSAFVNLVIETMSGTYEEKRESADKLWEIANSYERDISLMQGYHNLQEDVRTAVEEIEGLCEGRKTVPAVKVLSIVHDFLM